MIDWGIIAKIAGGGFGVTIFVLVVILLAAWLMGLAVQKFGTKSKKSAE
jgi:hypothetical protein